MFLQWWTWIDRKTRSLINLAMISALNRPHEVKMHIKGALNNGRFSAVYRKLDGLYKFGS